MSPFARKVCQIVSSVPRGLVATYSQIALLVGRPGAARAVGNVLHQNSAPRSIPCHRVVNAQGGLAQHFAFGGLKGQKMRLEKEGVEVRKEKVDLAKYQIKALKP